MPAAEIVIRGEVLVGVENGQVERAEAIGVAGGRVVAVGPLEDVRAAPGARRVDARGSAVIPGLHDFHVHLVGLARARAGVDLEDAADGREVLRRITAGSARPEPPEAWVTGRGWWERQLARVGTAELEAAVGGRPAFLRSHDGHSAWASAAARAIAGLTEATADPAGGRIERDEHGRLTGILRETALDLVSTHEPRLQGAALRPHLDATLRELVALGITGMSEAGDYTDENGIGADAALGDSASTLLDLGDLVDGRLRLTVGIPADAITAAAARGYRTGGALGRRRTLRFGWAKEYADGALGSGTAALFEARTCGDHDRGLMRVTDDELDRLIAAARDAGIGVAVHAIGDRAAAVVLDAFERAPSRTIAPADRMEHAQLVRVAERARIARLGVVASVQPIHAAGDRDLVEDCWRGRQADAYAWRSLLDSGALLAAGSDAPVESVDPWRGIFAAAHRRYPEDSREDWRPEEALTIAEAIEAYTRGPAVAIGAGDEGHLRQGARADLAVLTVGLEELLTEDVDVAGVRSTLTLVDGRVVD